MENDLPLATPPGTPPPEDAPGSPPAIIVANESPPRSPEGAGAIGGEHLTPGADKDDINFHIRQEVQNRNYDYVSYTPVRTRTSLGAPRNIKPSART